jgi:trigger factor
MQVHELKNEGLKREYKVTLPAKDLNSKVENELKSTAKTIRMDGFRPGKVPLQVVRKKHGASILAEVMQRAISDATEKLLEERKIFPVLQPKIEVNDNFDEGKDLEYTVAVEVYPEIPEIAFKEIIVEKPVVDVSDKEIESGMERLLRSRRSFEPLARKRAAKEGDTVVIDFLGKVDDVPFDGGAAKDFRLELGSGQFIPGYEEQLVGTKTAEKKDVTVTFPENYGSKELAGKEAVFEVTVNEILEPKLPEVNDAFAVEVGYADLAALKEDIKKQITLDYDNMARFKMKKELFDALETLCVFEAPESMVKIELDSLQKQTAQENAGSEKNDKETKEQKKELEAISLRRVKVGLLLSDLGRKNNVEVTQDEVRSEVFRMARNYPGQEQQVLEFYQKNPQALEQLKGPILEDKVVDYLFENVQTKETKISSEKLQAFMDE